MTSGYKRIELGQGKYRYEKIDDIVVTITPVAPEHKAKTTGVVMIVANIFFVVFAGLCFGYGVINNNKFLIGMQGICLVAFAIIFIFNLYYKCCNTETTDTYYKIFWFDAIIFLICGGNQIVGSGSPSYAMILYGIAGLIILIRLMWKCICERKK
jgi:hypothetical protein